ncbi:hypothetical protein scyTo_0012666 [Scyliorhinus torazame]|uniref:Uncharacterized protein n=1 Tax=Scyliorhinus torazame TaxID=75743 RepID=A0A401NGJ1_SCYTO|nr:hypothetical protein [Scyliorhinus torazame]
MGLDFPDVPPESDPPDPTQRRIVRRGWERAKPRPRDVLTETLSVVFNRQLQYLPPLVTLRSGEEPQAVWRCRDCC